MKVVDSAPLTLSPLISTEFDIFLEHKYNLLKTWIDVNYRMIGA